MYIYGIVQLKGIYNHCIVQLPDNFRTEGQGQTQPGQTSTGTPKKQPLPLNQSSYHNTGLTSAHDVWTNNYAQNFQHSLGNLWPLGSQKHFHVGQTNTITPGQP